MGSSPSRTGGTKSAPAEVLKIPDLRAILDAGTSAQPANGGVFSSQEYATAHGIVANTASRIIGAAVRAGKVEFVGNELRPSITKRMVPVPVYRVAGE